ncbi:MAG: hypothetical protein Ta2B_29410 [Termitinemataceae bacterium]|nr:MAG: hypothetical protein Ta2B_29410 [Termitinemataceae bacterium]
MLIKQNLQVDVRPQKDCSNTNLLLRLRAVGQAEF